MYGRPFELDCYFQRWKNQFFKKYFETIRKIFFRFEIWSKIFKNRFFSLFCENYGLRLTVSCDFSANAVSTDTDRNKTEQTGTLPVPTVLCFSKTHHGLFFAGRCRSCAGTFRSVPSPTKFGERSQETLFVLEKNFISKSVEQVLFKRLIENFPK